jgi:CRP-like cAMP-binding protein
MQLSIQRLNIQETCQISKVSPLLETEVYSFKRGQSIDPLLEQEALWRIHSGYVRTYSLEEDGTFIPLGFWGKGDFVGNRLSSLDPFEIECITDVMAVKLPERYEITPQILMTHLQQAQEFVRTMHQRKVEDRLLNFLSMLAHRFGHQNNGSSSIEPYLTHEQIAASIGTSRITVTKAMSEFKQSGKLCWSSQHRSLQLF